MRWEEEAEKGKSKNNKVEGEGMVTGGENDGRRV